MAKINSLIQDKATTKSDEAKLVHLKTELLNHKSLFEKDFVEIFSLEFKDGRNPWLHFISVNIFLLLVILVLPLIYIVEKDNNIDSILILIFIVEPLLLLCGWVIATMFSKIPLLGNPWWNYGLNVVSSLIITGFINISLRRLRKVKAKNIRAL